MNLALAHLDSRSNARVSVTDPDRPDNRNEARFEVRQGTRFHRDVEPVNPAMRLPGEAA